jgi:hypothetical protein
MFMIVRICWALLGAAALACASQAADSLAYHALRDSLTQLDSAGYARTLAGAGEMASLGFYGDATAMLREGLRSSAPGTPPRVQSDSLATRGRIETVITAGGDYVVFDRQDKARTPEEQIEQSLRDLDTLTVSVAGSMRIPSRRLPALTYRPSITLSERAAGVGAGAAFEADGFPLDIDIACIGEVPYRHGNAPAEGPSQPTLLGCEAGMQMRHESRRWWFRAPLRVTRRQYTFNTPRYSSHTILECIPMAEYRVANGPAALSADALIRYRKYDHDRWDTAPATGDSLFLHNLLTLYPSVHLVVPLEHATVKASLAYAFYRQPAYLSLFRQQDIECRAVCRLKPADWIRASLKLTGAFRRGDRRDTVRYQESTVGGWPIIRQEEASFAVHATDWIIETRLDFRIGSFLWLAPISRYESVEGDVVSAVDGRAFADGCGRWLMESFSAWEPGIALTAETSRFSALATCAYRFERAPEEACYGETQPRQITAGGRLDINMTQWLSVFLFTELSFDGSRLAPFNRMLSGSMEIRL